MATALMTPDLVPPPPPDSQSEPVGLVKGDQRVEFVGIGWEGYEALLKVQGEKSRPQMVYLDGDVWLMSPSHFHESLGDRLGTLVREVFVGLDIPCIPTRETTFHRHKDEAGVQPDDSFYFANHAVIAAKGGKKDIDLRVDPPPDLVIEVVHTHEATHAIEVLRRFGVPEVWVGKRDGLLILVLQEDGTYAESETSKCFPFLTGNEIFQWASRPGMTSTTQWIKELRGWVHETLIPRWERLNEKHEPGLNQP